MSEPTEAPDLVNHPPHYQLAPGVEVIDLTEHLTFCRGNAVKYLCRAGAKAGASELEDLRKAEFYVQREIARVQASQQDAQAAQEESLERLKAKLRARRDTGRPLLFEGVTQR